MVPDWRFDLMGLSHSPRIITNGLVLCVDAANKRSYPGAGTTWTDLTANKNNGTLTNMTDNFSTDGAGSLTFDGANEYVACVQSFSRNQTQLTISSWVKFNNFTTSRTIYVETKNDVSSRIDLAVTTSQEIRFAGRDDDSDSFTQFAISATSLINTDVWYNIVGVYDPLNTNNNVYLNSVNVTSSSSNLGDGFPDTTSATQRIGNNGPNTGYMNGNIAQVSIYNRALTASEIQQNYLATKGRYA